MLAVSADLYIYDGHLKYQFRWKDQPGSKSLSAKWMDHGFKQKALDKRVDEVNDFLLNLASWLTKVLNSPVDKALKKVHTGAKKQVNLLSEKSKDKRKNVLSGFFDAESGYDATRSTISFGSGGAHPDLAKGSPTGSPMAQSMSAADLKAIQGQVQAAGRQSAVAAMTTPAGGVQALQQQVAQQQRRGSGA